MSNIDKQALREEFQLMQDHYSDPADREHQVIYIAAEALLDELEAAEKRIEEGICRANREHHRGFMMACNHLKEHANIHYADAAEMEIAALRQRINQLEARTVTMQPKEHDNGTDSQIDINAVFANRMWQKCADAIRAAGIGVKGGEHG
ncbi:ead/Ea22-like family protein [Salmonella enterica subsp. enterica]|nr:ead/Ea22-like family protein [Salmonella enterica subsp. enterica serovar Farmsen]